MKQFAIRHLALIAGLFAASSASAANYEYTGIFDYVGKPALADRQSDARLQTDTSACDAAVGAFLSTAPSAKYRACMLQHGWKYRYSTREKVRPAPAYRPWSVSTGSGSEENNLNISDPQDPNNPNNPNGTAALSRE